MDESPIPLAWYSKTCDERIALIVQAMEGEKAFAVEWATITGAIAGFIVGAAVALTLTYFFGPL